MDMPKQQTKWYQPRLGFWGVVAMLLMPFQVFALTKINAASTEVSIQAPAPWVVKEQVKAREFSSLHSPSHYHLVDKQINGTAGKQVYSRYVYTLTDPSGVESGADIRMRFDPAFESLVVHAIKVLRDGKQVNSMQLSDIQIISAEDRQANNIYSGDVDAVVLLSDVRVGDVIDYSYTIAGVNPVFGNKFSSGAALGWSVPVDKVNVRVLIPSSRSLQTQFINSDAKFSVSENDGQRLYSLQLLNTAEIEEEDGLPAWYDAYPYVQLSEYKNWAEVAQWASNLFDVDHQPSAVLAAYINTLKSLPLEEAISAAINFSQDEVRYLGLELGENSHRPHSPSETFANRQGDCKDKALLLSVILNQLGISAYPALVSTTNRAHVSDYLPTHAAFNHAIVALDYQDTRYWIDATMTHQGKQLNSKFQADYGQALIVDAATTTLVSAVPSRNAESHIAVQEKVITADYSSAVEWTITTTLTGQEADRLRYRIKSEGQNKMAKAYLNYYAKRFPSIEALQDLQVLDDLNSNTLITKERYLVPGFWQLNAQKSAEFALHADYARQYVELPKAIKRSHPLAVYPHISIQHEITLQLPEHIDFTDELRDQTLQDQHIKFTSALLYDNRLLTLRNSYRALSNQVELVNMTEHLALLDKIWDNLSYYNSITNVTSDPGVNEMHNLLQQLNNRLMAHSAWRGE